jgi:colicin import membrane protein
MRLDLLRLTIGVVCAAGFFTTLVSCSVAPLIPDETLMPQLNAKTIQSEPQAERALEATANYRQNLAYLVRQDEIACYAKFFVNSCLADVDWSRRQKEARLRNIDVLAQSVIRGQRAIEKSRELANAEIERQNAAAEQASGRAEGVIAAQERLTALAARLQAATAANDGAAARAEQAQADTTARLAEVATKRAKAALAATQEDDNRALFMQKAKARDEKLKQAAEKDKAKLKAGEKSTNKRLPKAGVTSSEK